MRNMRAVIKRGLIAMVAVIAVLSAGYGAVSAQTSGAAGNGFRVSPVRSEYTIDKGKGEVLVVTVENPTDAKVTAKPVVNDFVASDQENGEPRLILDENAPAPRNSFKKLVGPMSELALGPREKKDIKVNINVPQNANAGGYYGAVRFVPSGAGEAGNVGLTASVGTIILVKVPGDLTERLDLVELSASQGGKTKSFLTGGNVQITTRLKNTGDIHVQPFGKVEVKNMFGKVIKEYELNAIDPRANILPESTRKFEDAVDKPGGGWFGRYTVTANIGFSQGGGDLITAKSNFWYLPKWFLILILVLIVAAVGAVFWFKNKRGSGGAGRTHRARGVRRF